MINEFEMENNTSFTVGFSLKHEIKFGQNVYILGSLPGLGDWKHPMAKLKWTDGHVWKMDLQLSSDVEFFEYKSVIRENSNNIWEKGHNRMFSRRNYIDEDYISVNAVWEKFYINFMIYYPVSDPNEFMQIMGRPKSIGKWFNDGGKPVKMKLGSEKNLNTIKGRFWEYKAEFDVNDQDNFEFDYRYSIFNTQTNTALWEREPNRKLIIIIDPKALSIDPEEYDKLFPVSNKEYELLIDNDIVRFDTNFVSDLVFNKMGDFPIYIGPYPQNGKDIEILKKNGITAVLNVQSDLDFLHRQINWQDNLKSYDQNDIHIQRYPIFDFNPEDLIRKLKGAVDLLNNLIRNKHVVYVHCTAGMSRAAAIVICYLYMYQYMSLPDAIEFVKSHRSIICPNYAAIQQVIKNEESKDNEFEKESKENMFKNSKRTNKLNNDNKLNKLNLFTMDNKQNWNNDEDDIDDKKKKMKFPK